MGSDTIIAFHFINIWCLRYLFNHQSIRINVFYVDLEQVFKHLEGQVNIYGTLLDGENIYDSKLSKNGIILMGNESKGISKENILHITKKILIPNYSKNYVKTESLNAAIATSIVCSEFKRRKYD